MLVRFSRPLFGGLDVGLQVLMVDAVFVHEGLDTRDVFFVVVAARRHGSIVGASTDRFKVSS